MSDRAERIKDLAEQNRHIFMEETRENIDWLIGELAAATTELAESHAQIGAMRDVLADAMKYMRHGIACYGPETGRYVCHCGILSVFERIRAVQDPSPIADAMVAALTAAKEVVEAAEAHGELTEETFDNLRDKIKSLDEARSK